MEYQNYQINYAKKKATGALVARAKDFLCSRKILIYYIDTLRLQSVASIIYFFNKINNI